MFLIFGTIVSIAIGMPVLIVFIILITVLILFLSSGKRIKDGVKINGIKKQDLRDYINNLPENERNDPKYSEVLAALSEQPSSHEAAPTAENSYERDTDFKSSAGYDSDSAVEVTVQSLENNVSFTFNIDGRVVGYIGPQRSVLTVPAGMHQVTIVTSDMNRKQIYSENILFNTNKIFTVKKKFGGYSVIKG